VLNKSFAAKASKNIARPKTQIRFDIIFSMVAALVIILKLGLGKDD
jgi:hypothetical protein